MSSLCFRSAGGKKRQAQSSSDQAKPGDSKTKGDGHRALFEVRREVQQRLGNEFKIDARHAKKQIEFGRNARGKKYEIRPKTKRIRSIKRDDRHESQAAKQKSLVVTNGLPSSAKPGPALKRFRARLPQGSGDDPRQKSQLNPAPYEQDREKCEIDIRHGQ